MGNYNPRPLDDTEKAYLEQLKSSGDSQTDIAAKMAEMAKTNLNLGSSTLADASGRSTELNGMLKDIMSGNKSFVDDNVAQQQWKRAKDNAAGEFASADRVLADRFASRGLSGGGQQRGNLRDYVLNSQNKTLANQATQIYGDVAKQKAVERASALDNWMGNINSDKSLGMSLTGMGGQNYGMSGNLYQGVTSNQNSTFNSLLGRQLQQPWWMGFLTGAGSEIIPKIGG